jgi:DtxR family Mn-dependent transcriptional regulator
MWIVATCSLLVAIWLMLAVWGLQRSRRRHDEALDDALKLIASLKLEHHVPTVTRLGGIMGMTPTRMLHVVDGLLDQRWVTLHDDRLAFTDIGRQRAVHLLRAHRLLETQLVYDAGLSLDQVHQHADRAEHRITEDQLAALNEHLGFPAFDPHGDPIPSSSSLVTPDRAFSLAKWDIGIPAVVVHVEDEPPTALRKVLGMGVAPGRTLTIESRDDQQITIAIDGKTHTMPNTLALGVQVRPADEQQGLMVVQPLSTLDVGQSGRIVTISPACQGFSRRRLLDLGLTPGTTITAQFGNLGRSATAYKLRNTLIALRQEQARLILIQETSTMDRESKDISHAI